MAHVKVFRLRCKWSFSSFAFFEPTSISLGTGYLTSLVFLSRPAFSRLYNEPLCNISPLLNIIMRFFTVSLAFAAAVAPALAAPVYVVPSGSGASLWGDVEDFGKSVLGALKREDLLALQARAADVQSGSGASWLGDLGKSFLDAFQPRGAHRNLPRHGVGGGGPSEWP
ncbi:hypothetical protein B0H21DRAFT_331335 [Amylocystis lapponica]|nr:hypothetical protein B0H21DRAFT_331335 [Amylocystis lapponica]